MVRSRRQTLSDLSFIEHALNTRATFLTPRHQDLLKASRTMARLRQQLDEATQDPTEQRAARRELLTAYEQRLNKLEHREGKASMPYFTKPRMRAWSEGTQISSVG
jgi:hypothetical protein